MKQPPNSEHPHPIQKTGWAGTFSSLSYKNFRLLWFATIFMSGGTWIQQITLGWLAFEMTNSPLQVSVVLGLRALPMLAAPVAGVIADIFDRIRIQVRGNPTTIDGPVPEGRESLSGNHHH